MQENHDLPGLLAILRGEAGETLRIVLTIALCVLFVLAVTGTVAVFVHPS